MGIKGGGRERVEMEERGLKLIILSIWLAMGAKILPHSQGGDTVVKGFSY